MKNVILNSSYSIRFSNSYTENSDNNTDVTYIWSLMPVWYSKHAASLYILVNVALYYKEVKYFRCKKNFYIHTQSTFRDFL